MKKATDEKRAEGAEDHAAGRELAARAGACAYLDLWERHVVETALHGPEATWRPTRS